MGIVTLFLILFLSIILTSYLLKLKLEDAIPVSNFIIIIVIYISGIVFLNLKVGITTILILILSGIIIFYKNKREKKYNYSRNGIIYFCLIFLFSIIFPYKKEFVSWDEFSHWGLVVKNMYTLNCFGNLESATTIFKGYPPAMSIFQYFFMKIYGNYKESLAYSGMIFFNLSLLSPLVKNIKSLITTLILTFFIIIFITIISLEIYTTIYIDLSLGVLTAYILFSSLNKVALFKNKVISIGLGIFLLPLMKSSGTFLATLVLVIIICNILKEEIGRKEKILKVVILSSFLIVSKYSWDIYTRVTSNFTGAWRGMENFTVNKFLKFWLNGVGEKYQFEVKLNFINALFEKRFSIYLLKENKHISFISLSLIILIISLIIYIVSKNKQKIKITLIGINLIGILYTFSLLNLYLYTFSKYEATRLASFSRYLNTYFIFAFISLFCIIISKIKENIKNSYLSLLLIVILPFLVMQYENIKLNFFQPTKRIKLDETLKKVMKKNDKLYFIAQNTKGYEYLIARYEYTPGQMEESGNWSIGEKYFLNDIWTKNITIDEFEKNIKNVNYIYLYQIDKKFKEKYGEIFKKQIRNISSGDIFKIDIKDGTIKFIKIDKLGGK